MMEGNSIRSLCPPLVAITLLSVAPLSVWAQEAAEIAGVSVRIVSVKPDSAAEWEAAVADLSASFQSQGAPFFHVYERLRGDNLPSYTIISLDELFGEVPATEIDPQVLNRIVSASRTSNLVSVETYADLGIEGASLAPGGPFLRTRVRVTSPANSAAYMEWEGELADALEEAGLTDMRIGRVVMGGNSNTHIRWSYQDSISGGQPTDIEGTIGQREFDRIIARGTDLETSAEDYVLRYRDDLSFTGN